MISNINLGDPKFYNVEKAELDLSTLRGLEYTDIKDFIIPFLNSHPEIKSLNLKYTQIGDKEAYILSTIQTIEVLALKQMCIHW